MDKTKQDVYELILATIFEKVGNRIENIEIADACTDAVLEFIKSERVSFIPTELIALKDFYQEDSVYKGGHKTTVQINAEKICKNIDRILFEIATNLK